MNLRSILLVSGLAVAGSANALTFTGSVLTENFDTPRLPNSGSTNSFASTALATDGWAIAKVGGTSSTQVGNIQGNDGSSNAGSTYSMGTTGSDERALGLLSSAGYIGAFGVKITNGTAFPLKTFVVSFDGEQWRSSTSTQNRLEFAYSTSATDLSTGTWVDVNDLDVVGQAAVASNGAIAGGADLGHYSAKFTFDTPVAAGSSFWLRWTDANDVGNDAMLGIDNFQAVPEPASMVALGLGAAAMLRRRRKA